MKEYPKVGLIRMSSDLQLTRADDDGEGGGMRTLTGTPIVFDQFTVINGWEGRFKERISRDAVTQTLEERGGKIKVLYNHGFDPQIGQKPLGRLASYEAKKDGLHIEVPLTDTSYNRDLQALIEDEALDGMSFRFDVIADEWEKLSTDMPERTVTELRLHEVGPVTFPAYEATTVGVRSAAEFEDFRLRQAALSQYGGLAPDGGPTDDDPAPSQLSRYRMARTLRAIDAIERGVTK